MKGSLWSPVRATAIACFALTCALLAISSGATRADASISVWFIPFVDETSVPSDVEIRVFNGGTEPLRAVTVSVMGSLEPETLSGPTVVMGSDDEVLDPGEEWSYRAMRTDVGPGEVQVTALTPSDETVSSWAGFDPDPDPHPIEATITPSTNAAISGDTVEWVVNATNVTDQVMIFHHATGAVWAGSSDTNSGAPITDDSPMLLVDKGQDQDDSWDPGETWRWQYQAVVTVDGSFLSASITLFDFDPGVYSTFQFGSVPIAVAPGPTSTASDTTVVSTTAPDTTVASPEGPSGSLPETGTDTTASVIAALGVLHLGALLILVARRGVASRG